MKRILCDREFSFLLEYFSWGDTIGQNKNGTSDGYAFSQANYNAGICGSGHTLTGDIPQGNPTYDAARANMGSPRTMPTRDQYQELIDNTTSTWTTINGVNGRKFISKTDSSKYIFLPAGGGLKDTNYVQSNEHCYYRSATIWSDSSYACTMSTDATYLPYQTYSYRYCAYSVRAIQ